MLYALGHPASFLVLLVSFVVGITLRGWVQGVVADRLGDRRPRLQLRTSPQPQHQIDPFGAVAAAIGGGGLGWTKPIDLPGRRRRGATVLISLIGPFINIAFGVGLLIGWKAALSTGPSLRLAEAFGAVGGSTFTQHGLPFSGDALGYAVLLAGASQLYLGVLSLIPLPPLDGGRLLFALAPRTPGWQKAEHYLVEQNIGALIVLVLVLLPLGGNLLLPQLLDDLLMPLLRVLLGV